MCCRGHRADCSSRFFHIFALACCWLAVVFTGQIADAAKPAVFWASDPVQPGEAVMLIGQGFGTNPKVEIARVSDESSSFTSRKPTWLGGVPAETIQPTDQSLRFVVPTQMKKGQYLLRISTSAGSVLQLLNAPQAWWIQGNLGTDASPGGWVRLFGKNLSRGSTDGPSDPLIVQLQGPQTVSLPAESDGFALRAKLPADLPVGKYKLTFPSQLQPAQADITVREPSAWPATVFNVKEFGAVGDGVKDDTGSVLAAVQQAEQNGGGIVFFPRGRYRLSDGIKVPRQTVLKGEKRDWTALCWIDLEEPPEALIQGTNTFALEELTLYARRHKHVIAGDLGATEDSGNIALRRVLVRADAFRGHPKPDEVDEYFRQSLKWSTGGGDTVRMGGPNIEITDCDFYGSGRSLFLSRVRGGLIARNNFYNGRWGWYCISGSNGLVFEENTLTGGDLMSTGGGLNCLDGSSSSENVYYANNKLRLLHGWDREAMTSDAGGEVYIGKVASAVGRSVTLAEEPKKTHRDWVGSGVFILDGPGAGQHRRVTAYDGKTVQIDRPWDVAPGPQSVLSITMFQGHYMVMNNEFTDTGAMQFYGTSIENFVVGNQGTRMPGFRGMGLWYHGFQPSWYCQFMDNEIIEGNYYHWYSAAEAKVDILGARRDDYEGPLNKGAVVRRNRLHNNAHIRISGTCRDVIVERNHVANNDQGIFVSKTVENSLVRENTFENVAQEVVDEEAARIAAEERMKKFLGRREPVAAWDFESLHGKLFSDLSGNGFTARIEGGVAQADQGLHGKAVHFDGTGFLRVEEPAVFNASDITVSLWFRADELKGRRGLIAKRFAGSTCPFVITHTDNAIRFEATELDGPWTFNFGTPRVLQPGQWTHVVAVIKQGAGVALCINGKREAGLANKAQRVQNDQPLIIGREAWGGDPPSTKQPGFFIGWIDDVKIWTRALSPEEIAAEYEQNKPAQ